MGSLAVLYLLLGAEFIAAAQVIVYAGAIMVLFVFVIMLLNAGPEVRSGRSRAGASAGHPAAGRFPRPDGLFHPATCFRRRPKSHFGELPRTARRCDVGQALFTHYLLPFEVISVLILIAILGAMVLAQKEMD